MHSYVVCMLFVCSRTSLVFNSYVTRMHLYATHMLLVCTLLSSVCHSSVVLPWVMTEKEYLNFLTCVYSLSQFEKELLNIELAGVLIGQKLTDLFIIYLCIYFSFFNVDTFSSNTLLIKINSKLQNVITLLLNTGFNYHRINQYSLGIRNKTFTQLAVTRKVAYLFILELKRFSEPEFLISWERSCQLLRYSERYQIISSSKFPFRNQWPRVS